MGNMIGCIGMVFELFYKFLLNLQKSFTKKKILVIIALQFKSNGHQIGENARIAQR
ncbi:MAG: Unknown protein [uncultured Sulfurovum sp.]|uniref:Uncharacterized protein n=1 Tax=uncultured Sulfurovum sp. TaxID=269237 RepID=A0A6S6U0E4_9BACT|nr:MAG: Unknown protein [uncultured Sulfurovum sp.]